MLDIRFIRENAELVQRAIRNKNVQVDLEKLLAIAEQRWELQRDIDILAQQRNENARAAGEEGEHSEEVRQKGRELKERIATLETEYADIQRLYLGLLLKIPNIPTPDTPVGADASGNKVLKTVGEIPQFTFQPKEHWEIGQRLGLIDNERAAKVAGSRFTYLKGDLVLMEFALLELALSVLSDRETLTSITRAAEIDVLPTPFLPVLPPALIKEDVLQKMARLEPKDERYLIPVDNLYLIGSAEHTLGPLHMDETLPENHLPRRYVGFSPAFRREAGSYGKDVHGILRMHQFDKIEMESFTLPESSAQEQEFFVAIQEHLMQLLGLPYQVVLMCTGDMGVPDARQIDLEAWFPGQNRYRETHTADLMTDYQARRLNTKVKLASGELAFVHMNDATVLAMGRTIAAVLENYQREDGSVGIPRALQPYLGGRETIAPVA